MVRGMYAWRGRGSRPGSIAFAHNSAVRGQGKGTRRHDRRTYHPFIDVALDGGMGAALRLRHPDRRWRAAFWGSGDANAGVQVHKPDYRLGVAGVDGQKLPRDVKEAEVHKIVDGDTIEIVYPPDDRWSTVRLVGINAPESVKPNTPVQCYGKESSRRLADILPVGATVYLDAASPTRTLTAGCCVTSGSWTARPGTPVPGAESHH